MRYACLVWLIAGCGFSTPAEPAGGDPGGSGSGQNGGSGSGVGTAAGQCDASDAQLRLCVSFGVDPMMQDLAAAHAVVEASGIAPLTAVLPIANILTGTAGVFGAMSHMRFADSPDFDVSELTVDLWMSPQSTPGNNAHYWMLDNNSQYYASFDHNNTVRCGIGGTSVNSQGAIAPGTWHHVACTYGAADRTLRVHVDGNVAGCVQVPGGIPQNGKDGLAIGANYAPPPPGSTPTNGGYTENFLGGLDALHLFARALTPDEICQAAGRTPGQPPCNTKCPGGQGPGPD
ncbi:MAG TPA: LamG domain-containing protein [Kofleriaceae bacterium]|nr:LamG domain-containing protein [Kofleriaceae bacterium]